MNRRHNVALITALALALVASTIAVLYWRPVAQQQSAPMPEPLTIAVIDTYIGSGLVQIAAAKGHFAAEGLTVTLQPHSAGRTALAAVLERKADLATMGNLPIVFATLNQVPLSIVTTISNASRGAGIVARRDRGVATAADLKGKTIGVTLGTDGHFVLGVLLAEQGIEMGEVRTQNIPPEDIVAALANGQVDAIATWEPLLSNAKTALGAADVAIDMDHGFSFWFQLVGQRNFVHRHPATMEKLLRALLRAQSYLVQHPAEASAVVANATRMTPELFSALWPNFQFRLTLPQGMLNLLEDQARWAIDNHYAQTAQAPNFLDVLYLDGLLAVEPQAVSIVR